MSWNVNGLRAAIRKGFEEKLKEMDPDIICLQEIKMQEGQAEPDVPGYLEYYNYADRKGYSGTAIFTKEEPISHTVGIGIPEHDTEGRVITLEFPDYYFVGCYTPNSQRGLARLPYRMEWEDAFRKYLMELDKKKPVVLCGDLNVAHKEIDLANPSSNRKNAGFSDEEREKFQTLLDSGFIDTFRYFYPDKENEYTWWSHFANARERNIGWRIDYFVVSSRFIDNVKDAKIHQSIMGSDHCPVEIILK